MSSSKYKSFSLNGIGLMQSSLERVPETGRLRFIDVGEAQEREVLDPIKIYASFLTFTVPIARPANTAPDAIRVFACCSAAEPSNNETSPGCCFAHHRGLASRQSQVRR